MTDRTRVDPKCLFATGASAGFGASLARRFVGRGARVIMAARRFDRLEALADELGERALPVHQFSLNLRSDLHETGIRVTCIEPGICVGTEFSEVRFGGDKTLRLSSPSHLIWLGLGPLHTEHAWSK